MTRLETYRSSPIRRPRRTKAEIEAVRTGLYEIVAEGRPMTVRQAFYQAVTRGLVAKTEAEYKSTVGRLLTEMRLDHTIPFGWIADNTRWMRKPRTFSSMEDALADTARTYRRQFWGDQDAYVEVWLEKEALAGVVVDVTAEFDVPLMVTRGYPSVSFLHEAAESIEVATGINRGDLKELLAKELKRSLPSLVAAGTVTADEVEDALATGKFETEALRGAFLSATDEVVAAVDEASKPAFIYYFGDHDPSGVDIPRNVEERLREFAAFADISFERVAVTEDQIEELNLPTRPTKTKGNPHAKGWVGDSVELDAIPVEDFRSLVRDCIEQHVDHDQLDLLETVEAEERQVLERLTSREFVDLARNQAT